MALPYFHSTDQQMNMLQTNWKAQLDPLLNDPLAQSVQLVNIPVIAGINVINHKLGHMQQGWIITDINANATLFRSQPFNSTTLTLTSSAAATISLLVY